MSKKLRAKTDVGGIFTPEPANHRHDKQSELPEKPIEPEQSKTPKKTKQPKKPLNKKLLRRAAIIASFIAFIISIVVIIILIFRNQESTILDFPACLEENIPVASIRSISDDVNISACKVYSESQNIEQYINTFIDYEKTTDLGSSSRAELYSALARNLYNYRVTLQNSGIENHDYDSRIIEFAKQADTLNPTYTNALVVFDYATNLGDSTTAAEYQTISKERSPYNYKEAYPNVQAAG